MLTFRLGPLSCVGQLMETDFLNFLVKNWSTWKCFRLMNTDTFYIWIQSFQPKKIKNSDALAPFKTNESQSSGISFLAPLFRWHPECLVRMQTHLTPVSLFYYSVDIKAPRSFFWERISWDLAGLELILDMCCRMTLNSWLFYHDLSDSWANGHDSGDLTPSFLNAKQVLYQLTYVPSLASPMALTANLCWKLTIFCCCISRFFCSAFTVVF